jgi:hypothetical protein
MWRRVVRRDIFDVSKNRRAFVFRMFLASLVDNPPYSTKHKVYYLVTYLSWGTPIQSTPLHSLFNISSSIVRCSERNATFRKADQFQGRIQYLSTTVLRNREEFSTFMEMTAPVACIFSFTAVVRSKSLRFISTSPKHLLPAKVITLLSPPTYMWIWWLNACGSGVKGNTL